MIKNNVWSDLGGQYYTHAQSHTAVSPTAAGDHEFTRGLYWISYTPFSFSTIPLSAKSRNFWKSIAGSALIAIELKVHNGFSWEFFLFQFSTLSCAESFQFIIQGFPMLQVQSWAILFCGLKGWIAFEWDSGEKKYNLHGWKRNNVSLSWLYAPSHFCASELFSTKQQQQPTYPLC